MTYAALLINTCTVQRYDQASIVIGTDGNDYCCIVAHIAAAADKPITGANYATYWQLTGGVGIGKVWVLGTSYIVSFDSYGVPVKAWANYLVAEPCRWSTPSNREVKVGMEVVIADLQLFLNNVVVTEQDRVILGIATYEILSSALQQNGTGAHHRECLLRTVR